MAAILGPVVGVGANHGIGVLISCLGLLTGAVSLVGLAVPAIRHLERDVPDHVAAATG